MRSGSVITLKKSDFIWKRQDELSEISQRCVKNEAGSYGGAYF